MTRLTKSGRKEYKCFGCHGVIHNGESSVVLVQKAGRNKLETQRLCIRCSVMAQAKALGKDGTPRSDSGEIRDGEFADEIKIPNFIKKAWKKFMEEHK